jgi:hypothetical protein
MDWTMLRVSPWCNALTTCPSPLVDYYAKHGALQSFQGTKSDVIYPEVKEMLEEYFDQ